MKMRIEEKMIKGLEWIVHLFLFGLGIFFIIQGNVVQRFLKKRTDFSQYNEDIVERPTIVTFIDPIPTKMKYGKDYHIEYQVLGSSKGKDGMILSKGENEINTKKGKIVIDVEELYEGNVFKITPYQHRMDSNYHDMKYVFHNTTYFDNDTLKATIVFQLSTENGSVSIAEHQPIYMNDGDPRIINLKLGEGALLKAYVEKTIYIDDTEECRREPFNDILFSKFSQQVLQDCPKPCRPKKSYGKNLDSIFAKTLKFCENKSNEFCFQKIDIERIVKRMIQKPCTKIQYSGNVQIPTGTKDQARFTYYFGNPAKVIVQEEYLVYDFVTMIGSIGGTLGLCIGFSFSGLFDSFLASFKTLALKMTSLSTITDEALFTKTEVKKDISKELELEKKLASIQEALQRLECKINENNSNTTIP